MAFLTAILTHHEPELVNAQLAYLRGLAPDSRFAICHGGQREHFDGLRAGSGVFIDDPSLRGPHFDKSINATLQVLYEVYVRDDPAVEFLYLAEYDQLILRPDFEDTLTGLARNHDAGLVAKAANRRDDSNWPHHMRVRDDARLNAFIAAIRWLPEYDLESALAELRAGRTFVHPFKRLDQLEAISQVRGSGANSSTAARSG